MKIIRFESDDSRVYIGCPDEAGMARVIDGNLLDQFVVTDQKKPVKQILTPLQPPAIYCIGLNYQRHAVEIGLELPRYPVVFMKNPGAATHHLADIEIPVCCAKVPEVDYEAELGVVIKTPAKNVRPETALDHVLGYTCANDVSARRWQRHAGGGQWVKAKSFDTFCPFGPWIVTGDEIGSPDELDISCVLNGRVMQESNTRDMIFSVARIISYLSESATLQPGTLILTGTPSGVGYTRNPPVYLMPGDILETRIERIGTLKNSVAFETP